MTNKELVQKAIITTDQLAAAGKLNPKQADKFIDLVIDVTGLSGNVRVARFRNEQLDIDKINVGQRVALPKTEAVAPSVRRRVYTSKISLNPKNVVVPFEISNDFMLENIEGEAVEDTVIRMMSTQFANDLEELYIDGDALGPSRVEADLVDGGSATDHIKDSYIALHDGWLKLAQGGHVVDANGANISAAIFSKMIKAMPDKWKRVRRNMRFFSSTDHEQNYRNTVAGRATAAGDAALSSTQNLTPYGVEIVPLPLLSSEPRVVRHLTLSGTTAVATGFKNISEVYVLPENLAASATAPFVEGTDYTLDAVNGTIARIGGGAIGDGDTVKVTFKTQGQCMLTEYRNFILGIGREITIKRDEDIYADVKQYAIHAKVAVQIEEVDAVVLAYNIGLD
jgi:hypothetical protein